MKYTVIFGVEMFVGGVFEDWTSWTVFVEAETWQRAIAKGKILAKKELTEQYDNVEMKFLVIHVYEDFQDSLYGGEK